jgi:lipoate-protein ligase A
LARFQYMDGWNMRQWRLIYDHPTNGVWNMAVDEALLLSGGGPVLRLYAWEPACLSLGYGQRFVEVDRTRLAALGWDVVRRPTGGRAVLHVDELTYSVVLPPGHALAAHDVIDSYRRISQALGAGLALLGEQPSADEVTSANSHRGPVCYELRSHYEVSLNGRKLVGSAQLRRSAGILQHGSIPLRGDIGRICEALAYPDEPSRCASREQVRQRAATLGDVNWEAAADALVKGFETALDVTFVQSKLTPAEQQLAEQLAVEVYGNPAWTERR